VADANAKKYRTPEEIVHHKENLDPLNVWKNQLFKEGVLNDESYRQIDAEAKTESQEAAAFAEQSPYPEIGAITDHVYFEVDEGSEASKHGRHFFHD
jgi:pyruvate dehydrogenase E1 component alpha subunit